MPTSLRVQSEDSGGETVEKAISIQIIDKNDDPTEIILDNATVPENLSLGIVVGELTTFDEDQTNTHFYSLVNGTGDDDNDSFSISGNKLLTMDSSTPLSIALALSSTPRI